MPKIPSGAATTTGGTAPADDQAVERSEQVRPDEVPLVEAGHVEEHDKRISAVRVVARRKIDVEVASHSEDRRKDSIDPTPCWSGVFDHLPLDSLVEDPRPI